MTPEPPPVAGPASPHQPRGGHLRVDAAGRDVLPALRLAAGGYRPAAIAARLQCSIAAVRRDLDGAVVALRAATVSEAIATAQRRGLLD